MSETTHPMPVIAESIRNLPVTMHTEELTEIRDQFLIAGNAAVRRLVTAIEEGRVDAFSYGNHYADSDGQVWSSDFCGCFYGHLYNEKGDEEGFDRAITAEKNYIRLSGSAWDKNAGSSPVERFLWSHHVIPGKTHLNNPSLLALHTLATAFLGVIP